MMGLDLIVCVRNKSDGPGDLGAWGGGALLPARNPAAARREPTGEGRTGVPRLGLDRGLAVAHVRDMGDALVALAGLKEVRGGAGSAAAGRRGETHRQAAFCGAPGLRSNWTNANGGVGL